MEGQKRGSNHGEPHLTSLALSGMQHAEEERQLPSQAELLVCAGHMGQHGFTEGWHEVQHLHFPTKTDWTLRGDGVQHDPGLLVIICLITTLIKALVQGVLAAGFTL